jgi:hypothetical protein
VDSLEKGSLGPLHLSLSPRRLAAPIIRCFFPRKKLFCWIFSRFTEKGVTKKINLLNAHASTITDEYEIE